MVVVLLRSGSKYIQQITWQLIDSKSKRSKCSISTPVFILLSILENVPTFNYSNNYEKKGLSLVFFVVLKGKMNYTLLSLEGDKDMDIGIVENKLISLLQFPFCSNRSKYGEINSENWRKICKTKLGLVLVSVIHFPFPVLYIHSTYMQQKYKLRPQTSTNLTLHYIALIIPPSPH